MSGSCPCCSNSHDFILNDNKFKFQCIKCKNILKYSPMYFRLQHINSICIGVSHNKKCPKCNNNNNNNIQFKYHTSICMSCKNTFSLCNLKQIESEYTNDMNISDEIIITT